MKPHKKAAVICENYRRELEHVLKSENMDCVKIVTFSANCHLANFDKCALALNGQGMTRREYEAAHIFHRVCASGVECKYLNAGACFRHMDELCFHMIAEKKLVDSLLRGGAHLLSPGWLEKWKTYLAQWGMERGMAAQFFSETARKLVLLDTLVDPASTDNLAEFSEFIGRPSESIPVGLDFFRNYIHARLG